MYSRQVNVCVDWLMAGEQQNDCICNIRIRLVNVYHNGFRPAPRESTLCHHLQSRMDKNNGKLEKGKTKPFKGTAWQLVAGNGTASVEQARKTTCVVMIRRFLVVVHAFANTKSSGKHSTWQPCGKHFHVHANKKH